MSIEGQGHFFTIYFPGFVCFVLYLAKISGERLQDHWSSGLWFGLILEVLCKPIISYFTPISLAHLSRRLMSKLISSPEPKAHR